MLSFRSHRFFVVAVSAVAILVDNLFVGIIGPLLPVYQNEFKLTEIDIGGLVAAYAAIQVIASPLAAVLIDRFGPRAILYVGLVSMLASTLLFALANAFWLLVFARVLQGACSSLSWGAALAMLPLALPPSELSRGSGVVVSVGGLGSVLGPVLGGALYSIGDDRRVPFWFMLGMVALDLVMRLLLVDVVRPEATIETQTSFVASVKELMRDGGILLLLYAGILSGILEASVMPLLPLLITERFDFGALGVGLVLSARSVTYLGGSPVAGWISDRFGRGRDLIAVGAVLLPLCFIASAYATNIVVFVLLMLCSGALLTAITTPNISEIGVLIDRRHSSRMYAVGGSLLNMVFGAASFVGPVFASGVAEATDTVVALCTIAGVMLPLAAIYCFFQFSPRWSTQLFGGRTSLVAKAAADDVSLMANDELSTRGGEQQDDDESG